MVRSDLGDVSREGGRSVIGGFAHPPLPFPSSPYTTTDGKERLEVLVEMGERLGQWRARKETSPSAVNCKQAPSVPGRRG